MAEDWQQIPTGALGLAEQQTKADDWAQGQQDQVAQDWATQYQAAHPPPPTPGLLPPQNDLTYPDAPPDQPANPPDASLPPASGGPGSPASVAATPNLTTPRPSSLYNASGQYPPEAQDNTPVAPPPGTAPTALSIAAAPGADLVPNQFGDPSLTTSEAYAACGPAAAVAFARLYGREPSLREATTLAKQFGWTADGGMNGIENEQRLLRSMGFDTKLDTRPSLKAMQDDASSGNPVVISTTKHYYFANAYDPQTGKFFVGQSGLAFRSGGGKWMSMAEIERQGAGINGALFADHPSSPIPSVAAQAAGMPYTTSQVATALPPQNDLPPDVTDPTADIGGWHIPYLPPDNPIMQTAAGNRPSSLGGLAAYNQAVGTAGAQAALPQAALDVPGVEGAASGILSPAFVPGVGAADLAGNAAMQAAGRVVGPVVRAAAGKVGEAVSPALDALGRAFGSEAPNPIPASAELASGISPSSLKPGLEKLGEFGNAVLQPVKNAPETIQPALVRYANVVGKESNAAKVASEPLAREIQQALGPADSDPAAIVDMMRSFEQTGELAAKPTPEQQALAAKLRTLFDTTKAEGAPVEPTVGIPSGGLNAGDSVTLKGGVPATVSRIDPATGEIWVTPEGSTRTPFKVGPADIITKPGLPGYIKGDVTKTGAVNNYFPHVRQAGEEPELLNPPPAPSRSTNPSDFYTQPREHLAVDDMVAAGNQPVPISQAVQTYAQHTAVSGGKVQLISDLQDGGPSIIRPLPEGAAPPPGFVKGGMADPTMGSPLQGYAVEEKTAAALRNMNDISAMRKSPLGLAMLKIQGTSKQSLFSLSNFHTLTEGLWTTASSPATTREMARAFADPAYYTAQRFGPMADTFANAARAGVTGLAAKASPDTGPMFSNPLVQRAISGVVGGAGAAGLTATNDVLIQHKSPQDTIRDMAIYGGAGAALSAGVAPQLTAALWERAIPMAKAMLWQGAVNKGIPEQQAADWVNRTIGGLNYTAMGRSPTMQDVFRMFFQAPDWNEATVRTIGTALFGRDQGAGLTRDVVVRAFAGMTALTQAVNVLTTGHSTLQNDDGRMFEVEFPALPGQTAPTFVGLYPGNLQAYLNFAMNRNPASFVRGRLSGPVQASAEQLYSRAGSGRDIVPKGTDLAPAMGLRAAALASHAAPIGVSQFETQTERGVPAWEAALASAFGLNLRQGTKAATAPAAPRFSPPGSSGGGRFTPPGSRGR